MKVSIHPGADRDLTDAFRFYRSEAGSRVAGRFLAEFERVTKLLAEYPDLGTPTGADRRAYPPVGFPYAVIYCRKDYGLQVLVVRHQSRDPGHGEQRS